MDRKEIVNSQDYEAEGVALDWYKSLNVESVGEIHITDAYADGVIYGWNNPQWIPVEEELPPPHYEGANSTDFVLVYDGYDLEFGYYDFEQKNWHGEDCKEMMFDVTHWMPLPQPPRKED